MRVILLIAPWLLALGCAKPLDEPQRVVHDYLTTEGREKRLEYVLYPNTRIRNLWKWRKMGDAPASKRDFRLSPTQYGADGWAEVLVEGKFPKNEDGLSLEGGRYHLRKMDYGAWKIDWEASVVWSSSTKSQFCATRSQAASFRGFARLAHADPPWFSKALRERYSALDFWQERDGKREDFPPLLVDHYIMGWEDLRKYLSDGLGHPVHFLLSFPESASGDYAEVLFIQALGWRERQGFPKLQAESDEAERKFDLNASPRDAQAGRLRH